MSIETNKINEIEKTALKDNGMLQPRSEKREDIYIESRYLIN